jgi:phosphoglycerate kinase
LPDFHIGILLKILIIKRVVAKKTLQDIDLTGKKVFIRVDFNVPMDEQNHITDDSRVVKSLPTIQYAIKQRAKIVLASHLGRPDGKRNPKYSLRPVAEHLSRLLKQKVEFIDDCMGEKVEAKVNGLREGEILLLENTTSDINL